MTNKQRIILELQMITGILTDDYDYMVYSMLRNGCYFQRKNKVILELNKSSNMNEVVGLEDWFDSI